MVQDAAQGRLGVARGGSGAAPGGISEAFWRAKIGANSESAIRSIKEQQREAGAAERNKESQNKL